MPRIRIKRIEGVNESDECKSENKRPRDQETRKNNYKVRKTKGRENRRGKENGEKTGEDAG